MDAKPQRPLRAFKIRDENIPPAALPTKANLQRNKSSPALSTLASQHNGPLKLGVRRTAFADLSNTTRANQTVKDDSALQDTKAALNVFKDAKNQENAKSADLARPAQRPLSVSGIKGLLQNWTSSAASNSTRQTSTESYPRQEQPPLLRRAKSKKSTAVLRDPPAQENTEARHQPYSLLPEVASVAIREEKSGESTTTLPYKELETTSHEDPHPLPPLPSSSSSFEDAIPHTQPPATNEYDQYLPQLQLASIEEQEIYVDAPSQIIAKPEPLRPAQKLQTAHLPEPAVVSHLQPVKEIDERPLREQYDDQYYEDGYTTSRSLRSRGDYTAGATTVVMAPRMSTKAEREIAAARQFMLASKTTEEIEEDESWDTSMVAEYGEEIFAYMHKLEERMTPNPNYMAHQSEVQWSMRSVLMDWLIQVHHRFQLLPETLFLCVNYIDRFLSAKVVAINKLQLVGATAILVAAKYEEITCPTVSEIQYMVDGSYSVDEILKAERFMLSMLQFELGWPGPMSFLRRISKADDYDLETRTLAKYFLEISIMDERFVACIPSFSAAGAHCLARLMLGKGLWSQAHVYYSNYTYSQLKPLLTALVSCCADPIKHHQAIFDKYSDKRFKRASYFVQNELDRGFILPSASRGSAAYTSMETTVDQWQPQPSMLFV